MGSQSMGEGIVFARKLQRHEVAMGLREEEGKHWWPWDAQRAEQRISAAFAVEAQMRKLREDIGTWLPSVGMSSVVRL
jgi:hypothetical protein